MEKAKISMSQPSVQAVIYDRLKGVDFSTDAALIDKARSPFAPNLISGPGGYPEKRRGWRTVERLNGTLHGIYKARLEGGDVFLAHAGTKLYSWTPYSAGTPTVLRSGIADTDSQGVNFKGKFYIVTGTEYLVVSKNGSTVTCSRADEETPYVPEIVIASRPLGGGAAFEGVNMLTPKRTVGFVGDGTVFYVLPEYPIGTATVKVEVRNAETGEWEEWAEREEHKEAGTGYGIYFKEDGSGTEIRGKKWTLQNRRSGGTPYETGNKYIVQREYGLVGFAAAPGDASLSGEENVRITYEKEPEEDGKAILNGCSILTLYDGRMWLSGNPEKPDRDWRSGIDDPGYFPENGYTVVGNDGSAIMGYRPVGTAQAIIKEETEQEACIYLRTTDSLGGETVYPIRQGVSGLGAISKKAFANLLDDPLYLTRTGVYGITSNLVTNERTIANRSHFLDPILTTEPNLREAAACQWNGLYLLSTGDGTCYALDGKQNKIYAEGNLTGGAYHYEAYHFTNIPAVCWMPDGENLFFGTADGRICRFNTDIQTREQWNDDGEAIPAARATRLETCGDFMRYKTMMKKGSGVMLKPFSRSSVKVCVRTDRNYEQMIRSKDFVSQTLDIFDWDDIDFERFSFDTDDAPRVVPFKKKIKKWKWIQIICRSEALNEGFGIYGIILRYQKTNPV